MHEETYVIHKTGQWSVRDSGLLKEIMAVPRKNEDYKKLLSTMHTWICNMVSLQDTWKIGLYMDRITPRERERERERLVSRVTQNSHRRTTCIGLGKMHQTNIHGKPRFRSVWVFWMSWLLVYNTKIRWVTTLISSVSPEDSNKNVDIYTTKRWHRYSQIFL